MRKVTCKQCGEDFLENDGNPAIHYSTPSDVCTRCTNLNNAKDGD